MGFSICSGLLSWTSICIFIWYIALRCAPVVCVYLYSHHWHHRKEAWSSTESLFPHTASCGVCHQHWSCSHTLSPLGHINTHIHNFHVTASFFLVFQCAAVAEWQRDAVFAHLSVRCAYMWISVFGCVWDRRYLFPRGAEDAELGV